MLSDSNLPFAHHLSTFGRSYGEPHQLNWNYRCDNPSILLNTIHSILTIISTWNFKNMKISGQFLSREIMKLWLPWKLGSSYSGINNIEGRRKKNKGGDAIAPMVKLFISDSNYI
jgi:hypothetical protein